MRLLSLLLVVFTLGTAVLVGGCGSGNSSTGTAPSAATATGNAATATTSTVHFAKTKFVLHAGLAFGAFHRYIYKPYRQGKFAGGLFHHKLATIKAGLAAAFAYHEVKLALQDARGSKLLSKALSPLLALQTKFHAMAAELEGGNANRSAIESANSAVNQTRQDGAQAGQTISDQTPPSF